MNTPEDAIAKQIVTTLVTHFAQANDIAPEHLLTTPSGLTSAEVLRAWRALGEVVFA